MTTPILRPPGDFASQPLLGEMIVAAASFVKHWELSPPSSTITLTSWRSQEHIEPSCSSTDGLLTWRGQS